jgi:chemotaxis protein MotC
MIKASMIRAWATSAALLAAGTTNCMAAGADRLRDAVHILATLQDQAAAGGRDAEAKQSKLIAQIETDLRNAPMKLAGDRATLEALALLLFSGGNPNLAENRVTAPEMEDVTVKLFRGALAYARADQHGALKELKDLDAMALPHMLGGRVALVRAILLASSDLPAALDDLSAAQRLMPGTLIEEGALRRCVAFAGRLARQSQLDRCALRYIRRFRESIYWPDFAEALVEAYARQPDDAMHLVDALRQVTAPLPASSRCQLALELARAALLRGKLNIALESAEWAKSLALAESNEMLRGGLYEAAAMVASDRGADAAAALGRMKREKLDARDRLLLTEAQALRHAIELAPAMSLAEAKQVLPPDQRTNAETPAP